MRYTKPTKAHLPKEARTIPIKAGGEENGKWFRCWNCGFNCFTDRDDHTGLTAGDNHTDNPEPAYGDDQRIVLGSPNNYHVIMEQDDSGDVTIVHDHLTNVTKGCPLCGTTNYKG